MPEDPRNYGRLRPLMDPQKLQHFLQVYELGNFARAAEAVHITQQAISKSVARLEDSIGVKLFERGAFGAEPTPFGHSLAKRAKIIVNETRLATAELSALKGAKDGFVRIGFGWSFLPRIAPQVINRFRGCHPGIALSIVTGDSRSLFDRLHRGDLELVASAPPPNFNIDEGLEASALFEERDVIVMRASHPLAQKPAVSLEELATQCWVVSLALQEQWQCITQSFINMGFSPPAEIIDMDSVTLAKSMIMQSDSLALLAYELVSVEVERGNFIIMERPEFPAMRPAYCTVRRGALSQPAATAFKNDLFHICRAIYGTV